MVMGERAKTRFFVLVPVFARSTAAILAISTIFRRKRGDYSQSVCKANGIRVNAPHECFLPRQNNSSFVADCFSQQRSTRRAHAQVLESVLRNNCNRYLVFFLHFWTILTIRNYARSLNLWTPCEQSAGGGGGLPYTTDGNARRNIEKKPLKVTILKKKVLF